MLDTEAVVNSDPVSVATKGAHDAEIANDELNTELEPCGPYTFEAVTKLAVLAIVVFAAQLAVPYKEPVSIRLPLFAVIVLNCRVVGSQNLTPLNVVTGPTTSSDPVTFTPPSSVITLPDIFVSRYAKLPSPS